MSKSDITLTLKGDKELLDKFTKLRRAGKGTNLRKAAMAGGFVLEGGIKRGAPVQTGHLRNSYFTVEGVASETYAESEVGTPIEYAPPVEFGTSKMDAQPHVRPAMESERGKIVQAIESNLMGQIDQVT